MQDLGDHCERADSARPHAGDKQQLRKVFRPAFRDGRQIAVQAARQHVARSHVMMARHDEMRQEELLGRRWIGRRALARRHPGIFARDRVRSDRVQHIDLTAPRSVGAPVGQVDDFSLVGTLDRRVRRLDEARQPLREPVIATRLSAIAVHALLHHDPAPLVGDDEAVKIKVEAVLNSGAVDFGDEPARPGERRAVKPDPVADCDKLVGRSPRMLSPPAADMDAELAGERGKAALQRADDAGRNPRRMPVHAHHRAERLKPERMGQPPQELVAAVVMDDRLGHHRPEVRHAVGEPPRHGAAMQRKIGAS